MARFQRGLNNAFINALNEAYANPNGWWRRVLEDRDLFIGIRGNSLNVYYNGASLLRLEHRRGELIGASHFKFLLQEKRPSPYVRFCNGQFDEGDLASIRFSRTLAQELPAIKRGSIPFHRIEAKGVHDIIRSNDNVIDTEVAFGDEGSRIDIAAFKPGDRGIELVMYEAKHFSNPEIFGEPPKVVDQIRRYHEILSTPHRAAEICESYRRIVENIAALEGFPARLRALCRRVIDEGFVLSTDVRLVIYGFDRVQLREAKALFARLDEKIGSGFVLKRGRPNGLTTGISR